MIRIKHSGSFNNTERFLSKAKKLQLQNILSRYAAEGVQALAAATPIDSGKTANSWGYEINIRGGQYSVEWTNSNVNNGVSIALILQLGHGTATGGYVQGRDYINPAIRPIFDKIADAAWREVTKI